MMRSLISLICLGGAIALFFFYTKPTYDGMQSKKAQIAQYDLALDKAAELQRLKQSLLSQYNSFRPEDLERLRKLLPDHVDNVRLILDLDTLASTHGLALQNVVVSADAPTNPQGENQVIGPAEDSHQALTLRFATTGTYPKFVEFLTDLEKSLRIVDVVDLQMDAASSDGEPTYHFDITLRTYWLK